MNCDQIISKGLSSKPQKNNTTTLFPVRCNFYVPAVSYTSLRVYFFFKFIIYKDTSIFYRDITVFPNLMFCVDRRTYTGRYGAGLSGSCVRSSPSCSVCCPYCVVWSSQGSVPVIGQTSPLDLPVDHSLQFTW